MEIPSVAGDELFLVGEHGEFLFEVPPVALDFHTVDDHELETGGEPRRAFGLSRFCGRHQRGE